MPTSPVKNKGRKICPEICPRIPGTFFSVAASASNMLSTTASPGGNTKLSIGTAMMEKAHPVMARMTEASSTEDASHKSAMVLTSLIGMFTSISASSVLKHGASPWR